MAYYFRMLPPPRHGYILLYCIAPPPTKKNTFNYQCCLQKVYPKYMDVSENSGTPKSSISIGFSIINHPIWGTPIFGNTQISTQQAVHVDIEPIAGHSPIHRGWLNSHQIHDSHTIFQPSAVKITPQKRGDSERSDKEYIP